MIYFILLYRFIFLDIEKLKASIKEVDEIVAKGIKENMDKATEA